MRKSTIASIAGFSLDLDSCLMNILIFFKCTVQKEVQAHCEL